MVSRNLRVRRMRTALTLLGIAVGMMAIVALMGLARGFENNWDQTLNARGTDVVVNRISTGSPIPAPFSEEVAREISALPGIEDSGGVLGVLMPVENLPMILVTSWEWESYIWNHLEIVEGRMQKDGHEKAVLLGKSASQMLRKQVGDSLQLLGSEFSVCGIYESTSMIESGAIVIPLGVMQSHSDNAGKSTSSTCASAPEWTRHGAGRSVTRSNSCTAGSPPASPVKPPSAAPPPKG